MFVSFSPLTASTTLNEKSFPSVHSWFTGLLGRSKRLERRRIQTVVFQVLLNDPDDLKDVHSVNQGLEIAAFQLPFSY